MSNIGHNRPPDMVDTAEDVISSINDWLKEHPVVQTEEEAREAKVQIDRGKLCVKDIEAERDKKVRPLNEQVKEINAYYKKPKTILEEVTGQAMERLSHFLRAEEEKRARAAAEAARLAEEAERKAREAEAAEQAALGSANSGVLDVDVKAVVAEADDAFDEYKKASRFADRAIKETKVKIGGGLSRAAGLKNIERLEVVDPLKAFCDLWHTEDLEEALLKSARAYRKTVGQLPPGIVVHIERKL